MRKRCVTWVFLVLAVAARAETGFLKTLPADEFTAAGLQKLTPEELARLETSVQRYRTGELTEMRQEADARAAASQQEAEKKIIAAEMKAREAEARAKEVALRAQETSTKAVPAPGQKQPSWFTALLTLKRAGEKPEKEEPLESRLIGDFEGWSGHTIFRLENGTRWLQQNKTEKYSYVPVLHAPKVKIKPAVMNGFWLDVEGVNLSVRVIPAELPEQK